jgi:hypothetical protein
MVVSTWLHIFNIGTGVAPCVAVGGAQVGHTIKGDIEDEGRWCSAESWWRWSLLTRRMADCTPAWVQDIMGKALLFDADQDLGLPGPSVKHNCKGIVFACGLPHFNKFCNLASP